jgi:hypothetical protein
MTFHQTITAAITASGLPPMRIAKLAGVNHSHLYRYISTGNGLSVASIERVCTALMLELNVAGVIMPIRYVPAAETKSSQREHSRNRGASRSRIVY